MEITHVIEVCCATTTPLGQLIITDADRVQYTIYMAYVRTDTNMESQPYSSAGGAINYHRALRGVVGRLVLLSHRPSSAISLVQYIGTSKLEGWMCTIIGQPCSTSATNHYTTPP
jgi:hypothetical protein